MSTYCDIDDIKLRVDSETYTNLTHDTGTLTGDSLCTAIIAEIDSYMRDLLAKSYSDVTALEGSNILKNICIELSICALMKRRQLNGVLIDTNQKERCSAADLLLNDLAAGNGQIIVDGTVISQRAISVRLKIATQTIDDLENQPYWYVSNE